MSLETSQAFCYSWHQDEKDIDTTTIRVYGLNEKNENVCMIIDDFTPYVYLELPDTINWTPGRAQIIGDRLDYMLRENKPVLKKLMYKKRLYYANIDEKGNKKTFPYLFCACASVNDRKLLRNRVQYRPIVTSELGSIQLKVHEFSASPILQLTSLRNIYPTGWVKFEGKRVDPENQITSCKHEFRVKWKKISHSDCDIIVKPLIMGYDIEVNSSDPTRMPSAKIPKDKIFQISCVFARQGIRNTDPENTDNCESYLLTLGQPDASVIKKHIKLLTFRSEDALLIGFTKLMNKKQPNICVGYNIFTFDIPYMIERSKEQFCYVEFAKQGMNKFDCAIEREIKWSSSAYKNQSFNFLEVEGRIFIDLLPVAKRDLRLSNYKLDTVAGHYFKNLRKDKLDALGIFKCFRIGVDQPTVKGQRALAVCANYCVKDSLLVVKLFEVMTTWFALAEMSKITNVPVVSLVTRGQQLKLYSQLYKKCTHENIIIEENVYKKEENYVGATIFDPIPGVYSKVVSFDFQSLYPTTIVAYNICWSTLVLDESVPDEKCHVMEWKDCCHCSHDPKVVRKNELTELLKKKQEKLVKLRELRDKKENKSKKEEYKALIAKVMDEMKPMRDERSKLQKSKGKYVVCAERRFRWLKSPMGILPEILTNLMDARSSTKKQMKALEKQLKEGKCADESGAETMVDVLNERQLALKVTCNSGYGCMGVKKGYLPFMPGAMCTTYMGRLAIEKAAKSIQQEHKGVLIYGDSVSGDTPIMIRYPDESVNILRIDGIVSHDAWEDYSQFKPELKVNKERAELGNIEVWTDNGWSTVRRIIRHKTEKAMFRVLTHTGCVDVTEDHSLLNVNREQIKPADVKIGDTLLHSFPKGFYEFDANMLSSDEKDPISLTKEESAFWGYFTANGNVNKSVNISGSESILENIRNTFFREAKEVTIRNNTMIIKDEKEVIKYHQLFYSTGKEKCIPYVILNSSVEMKKAFLTGYTQQTSCFVCNSKIVTQGLYFLLRSIGYDTGIVYRENSYYLLTDSLQNTTTCVKSVKRLEEEITEDFVYDLETEEGVFHAGIGELIVKNTDSNYVAFPHLKTAQECWDYAVKVAQEVTKLFPRPMALLFEEKIYWKFMILTKKRYMCLSCERDGVLDNKITKKGVLLTRRDNSAFVRKVYGDSIMMIFDQKEREDILYNIITELNKACSGAYPPEDFVITKSVAEIPGSLQEMVPVQGEEKGKVTWKLGDYKVRAVLPEDEKEREKKLRGKDCDNDEDYYLKCLPAQAQLAFKMRQRGQLVSAGSRIEYIITTTGGHTAKQYVKIESSDYYNKHKSVLDIDYLYYIKQLSNPLDQVLDIIYQKDKGHPTDSPQSGHKAGFVLEQYKLRLCKMKVVESINKLFAPKFKF